MIAENKNYKPTDYLISNIDNDKQPNEIVQKIKQYREQTKQTAKHDAGKAKKQSNNRARKIIKSTLNGTYQKKNNKNKKPMMACREKTTKNR